MPGLLKPILAPRAARRMAQAIDRAVAAGQSDRAKRLANDAAPLAGGCARLTETMARLRLAAGDAETALRLVDACRKRSASLRLLRAVCQVLMGEPTEASLDLLRWSALSAAPLEARLLLALLERHRDGAIALQALRQNLRHLEDPRTLEALLLLSVLRRRPHQTESWARRLAGAASGGAEAPVANLVLESLGISGPGTTEEPTGDEVGALALELIAYEQAIPVLTEASRRRPAPATIRLLRRAVEQALPDLADPAAALHALARLSLLLGERHEAREFAERGFAANPMSAALAILALQLREPAPSPQAETMEKAA